MKHLLSSLALLIATAPFATAQSTHQPYKDHATRDITSLSASDIDALENGRGWGLALPAELNGYPGPVHVLELAKDLDLSADQKQRITAIYDDMRKDAIAKGAAFIAAERALDAGFVSGTLDSAQLQALIQAAASARADLRYVHLSRHLMTVSILTAGQVAAYNTLRGYADDPCDAVPEGHNVTMWRRHNGCTD